MINGIMNHIMDSDKMTIESYKKWKAGEKVFKAKIVKEFYKTNPSDEQLRLWTKMLGKALRMGIIVGSLCGFGIAFVIFGLW